MCYTFTWTSIITKRCTALRKVWWADSTWAQEERTAARRLYRRWWSWTLCPDRSRLLLADSIQQSGETNRDASCFRDHFWIVGVGTNDVRYHVELPWKHKRLEPETTTVQTARDRRSHGRHQESLSADIPSWETATLWKSCGSPNGEN